MGGAKNGQLENPRDGCSLRAPGRRYAKAGPRHQARLPRNERPPQATLAEPKQSRLINLTLRANRYARHRPEESLLYAIVEQHGDAFFEHLAERDAIWLNSEAK